MVRDLLTLLLLLFVFGQCVIPIVFDEQTDDFTYFLNKNDEHNLKFSLPVDHNVGQVEFVIHHETNVIVCVGVLSSNIVCDTVRGKRFILGLLVNKRSSVQTVKFINVQDIEVGQLLFTATHVRPTVNSLEGISLDTPKSFDITEDFSVFTLPLERHYKDYFIFVELGGSYYLQDSTGISLSFCEISAGQGSILTIDKSYESAIKRQMFDINSAYTEAFGDSYFKDVDEITMVFTLDLNISSEFLSFADNDGSPTLVSVSFHFVDKNVPEATFSPRSIEKWSYSRIQNETSAIFVGNSLRPHIYKIDMSGVELLESEVILIYISGFAGTFMVQCNFDSAAFNSSRPVDKYFSTVRFDRQALLDSGNLRDLYLTVFVPPSELTYNLGIFKTDDNENEDVYMNEPNTLSKSFFAILKKRYIFEMELSFNGDLEFINLQVLAQTPSTSNVKSICEFNFDFVPTNSLCNYTFSSTQRSVRNVTFDIYPCSIHSKLKNKFKVMITVIKASPYFGCTIIPSLSSKKPSALRADGIPKCQTMEKFKPYPVHFSVDLNNQIISKSSLLHLSLTVMSDVVYVYPNNSLYMFSIDPVLQIHTNIDNFAGNCHTCCLSQHSDLKTFAKEPINWSHSLFRTASNDERYLYLNMTDLSDISFKPVLSFSSEYDHFVLFVERDGEQFIISNSVSEFIVAYDINACGMDVSLSNYHLCPTITDMIKSSCDRFKLQTDNDREYTLICHDAVIEIDLPLNITINGGVFGTSTVYPIRSDRMLLWTSEYLTTINSLFYDFPFYSNGETQYEKLLQKACDLSSLPDSFDDAVSMCQNTSKNSVLFYSHYKIQNMQTHISLLPRNYLMITFEGNVSVAQSPFLDVSYQSIQLFGNLQGKSYLGSTLFMSIQYDFSTIPPQLSDHIPTINRVCMSIDQPNSFSDFRVAEKSSDNVHLVCDIASIQLLSYVDPVDSAWRPWNGIPVCSQYSAVKSVHVVSDGNNAQEKFFVSVNDFVSANGYGLAVYLSTDSNPLRVNTKQGVDSMINNDAAFCYLFGQAHSCSIRIMKCDLPSEFYIHFVMFDQEARGGNRQQSGGYSDQQDFSYQYNFNTLFDQDSVEVSKPFLLQLAAGDVKAVILSHVSSSYNVELQIDKKDIPSIAKPQRQQLLARLFDQFSRSVCHQASQEDVFTSSIVFNACFKSDEQSMLVVQHDQVIPGWGQPSFFSDYDVWVKIHVIPAYVSVSTANISSLTNRLTLFNYVNGHILLQFASSSSGVFVFNGVLSCSEQKEQISLDFEVRSQYSNETSISSLLQCNRDDKRSISETFDCNVDTPHVFFIKQFIDSSSHNVVDLRLKIIEKGNIITKQKSFYDLDFSISLSENDQFFLKSIDFTIQEIQFTENINNRIKMDTIIELTSNTKAMVVFNIIQRESSENPVRFGLTNDLHLSKCHDIQELEELWYHSQTVSNSINTIVVSSTIFLNDFVLKPCFQDLGVVLEYRLEKSKKMAVDSVYHNHNGFREALFEVDFVPGVMSLRFETEDKSNSRKAVVLFGLNAVPGFKTTLPKDTFCEVHVDEENGSFTMPICDGIAKTMSDNSFVLYMVVVTSFDFSIIQFDCTEYVEIITPNPMFEYIHTRNAIEPIVFGSKWAEAKYEVMPTQIEIEVVTEQYMLSNALGIFSVFANCSEFADRSNIALTVMLYTSYDDETVLKCTVDENRVFSEGNIVPLQCVADDDLENYLLSSVLPTRVILVAKNSISVIIKTNIMSFSESFDINEDNLFSIALTEEKPASYFHLNLFNQPHIQPYTEPTVFRIRIVELFALHNHTCYMTTYTIRKDNPIPTILHHNIELFEGAKPSNFLIDRIDPNTVNVYLVLTLLDGPMSVLLSLEVHSIYIHSGDVNRGLLCSHHLSPYCLFTIPIRSNQFERQYSIKVTPTMENRKCPFSVYVGQISDNVLPSSEDFNYISNLYMNDYILKSDGECTTGNSCIYTMSLVDMDHITFSPSYVYLLARRLCEYRVYDKPVYYEYISPDFFGSATTNVRATSTYISYFLFQLKYISSVLRPSIVQFKSPTHLEIQVGKDRGESEFFLYTHKLTKHVNRVYRIGAKLSDEFIEATPFQFSVRNVIEQAKTESDSVLNFINGQRKAFKYEGLEPTQMVTAFGLDYNSREIYNPKTAEVNVRVNNVEVTELFTPQYLNSSLSFYTTCGGLNGIPLFLDIGLDDTYTIRFHTAIITSSDPSITFAPAYNVPTIPFGDLSHDLLYPPNAFVSRHYFRSQQMNTLASVIGFELNLDINEEHGFCVMRVSPIESDVFDGEAPLYYVSKAISPMPYFDSSVPTNFIGAKEGSDFCAKHRDIKIESQPDEETVFTFLPYGQNTTRPTHITVTGLRRFSMWAYCVNGLRQKLNVDPETGSVEPLLLDFPSKMSIDAKKKNIYGWYFEYNYEDLDLSHLELIVEGESLQGCSIVLFSDSCHTFPKRKLKAGEVFIVTLWELHELTSNDEQEFYIKIHDPKYNDWDKTEFTLKIEGKIFEPQYVPPLIDVNLPTSFVFNVSRRSNQKYVYYTFSMLGEFPHGIFMWCNGGNIWAYDLNSRRLDQIDNRIWHLRTEEDMNRIFLITLDEDVKAGNSNCTIFYQTVPETPQRSIKCGKGSNLCLYLHLFDHNTIFEHYAGFAFNKISSRYHTTYIYPLPLYSLDDYFVKDSHHLCLHNTIGLVDGESFAKRCRIFRFNDLLNKMPKSMQFVAMVIVWVDDENPIQITTKPFTKLMLTESQLHRSECYTSLMGVRGVVLKPDLFLRTASEVIEEYDGLARDLSSNLIESLSINTKCNFLSAECFSAIQRFACMHTYMSVIHDKSVCETLVDNCPYVLGLNDMYCDLPYFATDDEFDVVFEDLWNLDYRNYFVGTAFFLMFVVVFLLLNIVLLFWKYIYHLRRKYLVERYGMFVPDVDIDSIPLFA
ncbi:hypothetical protein PCE1_000150 [Barthelona sp. PCE]